MTGVHHPAHPSRSEYPDVVNRYVRVAGPGALVLVALLATLAGLAFGGGADAPRLLDPGATVRFGIPLSKLLLNLGMATTIGALVLAGFAFAKEKKEYGAALDIAAAGAAVWTVSAGAYGFLTFLSVSGQQLTFDASFGDVLAAFLSQQEFGRALLATVLAGAALTVLCFAVRNQLAVLILAAFAVLAMIPISQQGHAGGTESHDAAVTAIWLHTVFAAIWLGGLVTLALLRGTIDRDRIPLIVARYSSFALIAFIVVAVSGYASAAIRLGTPDALPTDYGILVIVKVLALLALGGFGALHRQFVIRRIAGKPGLFWWLVTAELAFMGIASGVAAALARTAPPQEEVSASEQADPTPAELLTGRALPPEPTLERYLWSWDIDLLWTLVCGFALFFYLAAVWRLHRRGDRWPVLRTLSWAAGILTLFYATSGGVNVYEKYLFSAHMLEHMILGMVVPVLLVPGAPITLALRTIARRTDGSRGPREWLLLVVHSRYFAVLGHPIVAASLFVGSLWIFYYTPLLDWATTDHVGHQWMIIHFVATGYLFVQSLIGVDPSPGRPAYPIRLVVLFATMALHAFFGLALVTGESLLLADWYGAMGWDPPVDALADQQRGGAITWSVGEIPTLALAIAVAIGWARSDTKESKRLDRKADRDGDADLTEYNEMLAARAEVLDRSPR